jgi:choline dehydrogenase-like flavoprotein
MVNTQKVPITGNEMELEYDVVVVGSGAGGGVCAATLSQQGFKVLVLEKAEFVPPDEVLFVLLQCFSKINSVFYIHGSYLT